MGNPTQTVYNQRSDREKIESQWRKLSGHMTPPRRDWAAAVVRAATAAEIAANLVVRAEYAKRNKEIPAKVIDDSLRSANGLDGKMKRLIRPLLIDRPNDLTKIEGLYGAMRVAIKKRNAIVHGGEFCDEEPARLHIAACKAFVEGLVAMYHADFVLPDPAVAASDKESRA
jgi:hypothetical protein